MQHYTMLDSLQNTVVRNTFTEKQTDLLNDSKIVEIYTRQY